MKLTRRVLLGKLPVVIAGLWAMVKGRKREEETYRTDWWDPVDGKHATELCVPPQETGHIYWCARSGGDEASNGLDPDNPTTFANAWRMTARAR